ncbi:MAG: hypothetical protein WC584_01935 [Candidatus Pacearchaeota archaeon]
MVMNKRGTLAITQILILIIGIVAFSWEINLVSGADQAAQQMYGGVTQTITETDITASNIPTNGITNYLDETGKTSGGITNYFDNNAQASAGTTPAAGAVPGKVTAGTPTTYFGIFKATSGGAWSGLLNGLQWAAAVGAIVGIITMFLPEKYKGIGMAATYGLTAAAATYGFLSEFSYTKTNWGTGWNVGISAAIGIGIFLLMYKTEKTEIISFQCKSWDAPTKGSDCEKCNKQELPCSEYQCRSLGQACALVNAEADGEQMCVWQDIRDANPPEMKAWKEALLEGYQYKDPEKPISPPDRGTKIFYKKSANGCVPAFTPLSFGIETNEPAKCKLDYTRKKTFDEMQFFFGGSSTFKYNHTQIMSLPGPSASENVTIQNDGTFQIYTRCMDANGNANTATFVFQFCVDKGPDMTPPIIVTTNLLNNMPVSFGTNSTDIEVYTNEPATCKWTHEKDKDYDKMENTMQCSSSVFEMNAQMLYTCKTKLTGLENMKENVFYFKCKDQPLAVEGDRNVMAEGYKFTLIGTQPLVIDEVKPTNQTIKGSTDSIKVTLEAKTSAGFNRGESTCYYSVTGEDDNYQMFFYDTSNNMNYQHKQDLYLVAGNYEYYIKCMDLGGNYDIEKIKFSVETDTTPPMVVRAYHIETYLEIITNENAECVYDIKDCSYDFDKGTPINRVDEDNVHYLDWNSEKTYYIKCKDEFGNMPAPNQCSIVVRAFESLKGKEI